MENADDLAAQTEIEYGVLKHSSAEEFFRRSRVSVYARMWEFMNSRFDVFVDSTVEGIQRVRESKGKYAFILDGTTAEYVNERMPCDTATIGKPLNTKSFGIATPIGSSIKVRLNLAVMHLVENGDIEKLKNKWL